MTTWRDTKIYLSLEEKLERFTIGKNKIVHIWQTTVLLKIPITEQRNIGKLYTPLSYWCNAVGGRKISWKPSFPLHLW